MKKVLFLLLFVPIFCYGQNKEQIELINKWKESGYFKIDGENIVVSRVIDSISGTKDDIYIKVKNYFVRAYKDANSVIQTDDKQAGTVIGKGLYDLMTCTYMISATHNYKAYHIMRVDIKDGKVRVICSVSDIDVDQKGTNNYLKKSSYPILDYAPIGDKRLFDKGKQTEAFIKLVDRMNGSINALEKSIKEGSLKIENEEW